MEVLQSLLQKIVTSTLEMQLSGDIPDNQAFFDEISCIIPFLSEFSEFYVFLVDKTIQKDSESANLSNAMIVIKSELEFYKSELNNIKQLLHHQSEAMNTSLTDMITHFLEMMNSYNKQYSQTIQNVFVLFFTI
jgi:hypothetical protein